MNNIKFFIGPMSKNVVDCILQSSETYSIGLIASRRQVDYCGGYVNNWDTKNFYDYVRKHSQSILICRDHGGENQGQNIDDGMKSLVVDCNYFNLVHVDPFKICETIEQSAEKTRNIIQKLWAINPNILYEVGTEEVIFKYSPKELKWFLSYLNTHLTDEQFKQIQYAVIQSGTRLNLSRRTNIGKFNERLLVEFISVVKQFGVFSKEHNGDYLSHTTGISTRFNLGLDSINIAPEFGQIESEVYLEYCKETPLFDILYRICYNSGKWKKWIPDINQVSKEQIIITCCHYVLSDQLFIEKIKSHFPDIDEYIQSKINSRLKLLNEQTKNYSI